MGNRTPWSYGTTKVTDPSGFGILGYVDKAVKVLDGSVLAKAEDVEKIYDETHVSLSVPYESVVKNAWIDSSGYVVERNDLNIVCFNVSKGDVCDVTILNHSSSLIGSAWYSASIPSVGDPVENIHNGTFTEADATETFRYEASADGYVSVVVYSTFRIAYIAMNKITDKGNSYRDGHFSSNEDFNNFFVELYTNIDLSLVTKIQIEKARNFNSNKRTLARFYFSSDNFIDLYRITGDSFAVTNSLTAYNSVRENGMFIKAIVNWDYIANGASVTIAMDRVGLSTDFKTLKRDGKLFEAITASELPKLTIEDNDEILKSFISDDVVTSVAPYTVYPFTSPVQSDKSICVFVNGIKKSLGIDYDVDVKQMYICFKEALQSTDVVNVSYVTRYREKGVDLFLDDCSLIDDGELIDGKAYPYLKPQFNDYEGQNYQWFESVTDPSNTSVNVLAARAKAGTKKCRCQLVQKGMDANELSSSVDIYLPSSSFGVLNTTFEDAIDWFTIQEYWTPYGSAIGATFQQPGHRVSLGINKDKGANQQLYFALSSESRIGVASTTDYYQLEKAVTNKDFTIPLDTWITIKTEMHTSYNGHYKMSVVVDGNETTIFDVDLHTINSQVFTGNYEHNSYSRLDPHTCLVKMYTRIQLLRYVAENSTDKMLQMYFKNLSWTEKLAE